MTDATANAGQQTRRARLTDGNVRYALWLGIYTLNFVDRQIVAVLGEDIKAALNLSDTQLGLLGGLAFALFYTVLGIPIARFAERGNRVAIISGALVWSGFTALCGTATSFLQILLYRTAWAWASGHPARAFAISDYVKPEKRASAWRFIRWACRSSSPALRWAR